ncbi:uncharacterized protein [Maniola hyperantus]|uniref:uncharacterized protein n=1 Tax=Aphantopus hyperantus TaxID=2795564 RepID=UPI003748891B
MIVKLPTFSRSLEFEKLRKEGRKFSMSFDEWTSVQNRRYLSLNLRSRHFSGGKNFKNLGLIRVNGSLPAKKCVEEISSKLNEFGVSLEDDIIAETTDGCSMMVKFGKYLSSYHQKCIAHALQLAISDVFYKNDVTCEAEERSEEETHVSMEVEDDDDDIPLAALSRQRLQVIRESLDEDSDSDNEDDGVEFLSQNETCLISERQFEQRGLLLKVKKVVKLFRKSPTKNDDVLQKYVIEDFHKEYSLICDSVTRWSSLANTLERFLKLRTCIGKALIDLNSKIKFSEGEWEQIGKLHEVLDIIKTHIQHNPYQYQPHKVNRRETVTVTLKYLKYKTLL